MNNNDTPVATATSEVDNTQFQADEMAAARKTAEQAVGQAREMAVDAYNKIRILEPVQLGYLGTLAVVVLFTIVFDMMSFEVYSNGAVTETQAAAERSLETRVNSWAYSAFRSTFVGKLMWLSAVVGIGILVWTTVAKVRAAWVPLAQAGCAAFATAMMLLLFVVGFPDMGALESSIISNVSTSATLFGYWIPLAAAGTATFLSVRRIFKA